jgi:hypothetical protein
VGLKAAKQLIRELGRATICAWARSLLFCAVSYVCVGPSVITTRNVTKILCGHTVLESVTEVMGVISSHPDRDAQRFDSIG